MTKLTFTTSDVSVVLQQPQSQVLELIRQGEIRARNCLSGAYTVLRQDLLSFMRKNHLCTDLLERPQTILIVNDNPKLQKEIELVLERLSHNCKVITISNGYEAVTTLLQEKTDLLILNDDSKSFNTQGIFKTLAQTDTPPMVITLSAPDNNRHVPPGARHAAPIAANNMTKLTEKLQHFIDNQPLSD